MDPGGGAGDRLRHQHRPAEDPAVVRGRGDNACRVESA